MKVKDFFEKIGRCRLDVKICTMCAYELSEKQIEEKGIENIKNAEIDCVHILEDKIQIQIFPIRNKKVLKE